MKKKKSKKKTSFISKTAMTVLTIILIILFFCIMSMVEKIQGTARVVNYAGLVRGKTQRIIKLEDAGEPQDTMIADINAYIDGLQNGSSELDLVRLDDFWCVKKDMRIPRLSKRVRPFSKSVTRRRALRKRIRREWRLR